MSKPKVLGVTVDTPETYRPDILDPIQIDYGRGPLTVRLECAEFTSLCPITGQPDFGSLVIEYRPKDRIIESKSLKLYLASFRSHRVFHENVVQIIATDLKRVLEPYFIQVTGNFNPRGGIAIKPTYSFHDRDGYTP
jgi:7-cyano-7-deazaguanine reductase